MPTTPPEQFAATVTTGSTPIAEAVVCWSFTNKALEEVSEPVMNTPSQPLGNWRWRLDPGLLTAELAAKLAHLAELTDRVPQPFAAPADENFAA